MASSDIGTMKCPICDHPHAYVRQQKTGRALITCPECSYQLFSRGEKSDKQIRAKMTRIHVEVEQPGNITEPKKGGFLDEFFA